MWQDSEVESAQLTLVEAAKALSSPTRVQILRWLADPEANFTSRREGDLSPLGVCASLIAERLELSQPTVSRHLDVLRRAGLVTSRRVAGWHFHRRDEAAIGRLQDLLGRL